MATLWFYEKITREFNSHKHTFQLMFVVALAISILSFDEITAQEIETDPLDFNDPEVQELQRRSNVFGFENADVTRIPNALFFVAIEPANKVAGFEDGNSQAREWARGVSANTGFSPELTNFDTDYPEEGVFLKCSWSGRNVGSSATSQSNNQLDGQQQQLPEELQFPNRRRFERGGRNCSLECDPIDDVRCSLEYLDEIIASERIRIQQLGLSQ